MNRWIMTMILAATYLGCMALAPSERTTRRGLRVSSPAVSAVDEAPGDTLRNPPVSEVKVSGFDKPLRSRFETMFVTNNGHTAITAICFTIDYTDLAGRQLHEAVRTLRCDIPPGETRQIKFTTWDAQSAFYYVVTGKPRRSEGSPFDIKCRINYVITSADSDATPD